MFIISEIFPQHSGDLDMAKKNDISFLYLRRFGSKISTSRK